MIWPLLVHVWGTIDEKLWNSCLRRYRAFIDTQNIITLFCWCYLIKYLRNRWYTQVFKNSSQVLNKLHLIFVIGNLSTSKLRWPKNNINNIIVITWLLETIKQIIFPYNSVTMLFSKICLYEVFIWHYRVLYP